jgi:metal-responsive CopG/Arc/MetJ family transcriptional regulator
MKQRTHCKRGAVHSAESELIAAWVPSHLLADIDRAVALLDTDRSKFLRSAVREKLSAMVPRAHEPATR